MAAPPTPIATTSPPPAPETLTRRAVKGTAWSTVSTVGRQILTFASLATVARILGPDAYGVMGMAAIVVGFIHNFRELGTTPAIIQKPSVSARLLSSLFWINAGFGICMCALVCGIAPWMATFFHTAEITPVLRVFSLSFIFASLGVVHAALLNREMMFRHLAIIDLIAGVVTYVVALVCAYNGLGVWSLVFANVSTTIVAMVGYWLAFRFRPALTFDKAEVMTIASYSSNFSAFGIVNYGCRNADNLIVGRVLGPVSLGFYQMAYNLMMTPLQNVSSVIVQVLFPAFSRIQDDNARFREAYVRSCMLIGLVTFPIMAGLGVVIDPLVRAVLGSKWLGAIPIFEILVPVGLVQSIHTTVGVIYQAKGRTDWMFRMSILFLGGTVTAFLIGVHYGAIGVAAGYAVAYFFLLYPFLAVPFRLINLRVTDFARALFPQLLWTAVMAATCLGWLWLLTRLGVRGAWPQLISTSAVGAIVYSGGLLLLRFRVVTQLAEVLANSESLLMMRIRSLIVRGMRSPI